MVPDENGIQAIMDRDLGPEPAGVKNATLHKEVQRFLTERNGAYWVLHEVDDDCSHMLDMLDKHTKTYQTVCLRRYQAWRSILVGCSESWRQECRGGYLDSEPRIGGKLQLGEIHEMSKTAFSCAFHRF